MKKHILLIPFILLFFCSLAQGQAIIVGSKVPMPNITILATEPVQPIEGSLVTVYFRFNNPSLTSVTGWIGADINSGTGQPGKSAIDWPVKDLAIKQSIDGAVMVKATDAGTGKKIRVFFYETQQTIGMGGLVKSAPKYEIAEKEINIAAILNFTLKNFSIAHTRANSTDTDWGSLYAAVNDDPVMQPSSIFIGGFQNGTYPFGGKDADNKIIKNLQTGPISLIPGINSNLYIAYTIYNGGGIVHQEAFLRGYAEATANPVLFHGPRPGGDKAWDVVKKLILPLSSIGYCDGLVVMDTLTISSNDIFTSTYNGNKDFSKRYNSEIYASQVGCGSTSDYTVYSTLHRLSSARNGSTIKPPVFINIYSGRRINLDQADIDHYEDRLGLQQMEAIDNAGNVSAFFGSVGNVQGIIFNRPPQVKISWQRIETIDKAGNFITVNDPAYGYISNNEYHAPNQVDQPLLVILRGSRILPDQPDKMYSLNDLNKGPLSQITFIIQLVPGQNTITNTNVIVNTNTGSIPGTPASNIPDGAKSTVVTPPPAGNRGATEVIGSHVVITTTNTAVTRPPTSPTGPAVTTASPTVITPNNGAATRPGVTIVTTRPGLITTTNTAVTRPPTPPTGTAVTPGTPAVITTTNAAVTRPAATIVNRATTTTVVNKPDTVRKAILQRARVIHQ